MSRKKKPVVDLATLRTVDRKKIVAECAAAIPTSWLDSIFTGEEAVCGSPPFSCPDVERILNAVRKRILALVDKR